MLYTIFLVLNAALLGSMVFFAVVVAPSTFRFIDATQAGQFLRGLFPRYYLFGLILSLCLIPLAITHSTVLLANSIIIAALFVIARQVLMPAINLYRDRMLDGDETAKRRFGQLHGLSVAINLLQMVLLGINCFWAG